MGNIVKDALTTKSGTVHKRERVTHSELFIFKKQTGITTLLYALGYQTLKYVV